MNTLSWTATAIDKELHPLLEILGEEYPIIKDQPGGIKLSFTRQAAGLDVKIKDNGILICYSSLSSAARGIGKALTEDASKDAHISEALPFETFGILVDCSRNATLKVDYFKKYLRRLALMGYNTAMLYTKDAYELPEEDFFGYLRGRYNLEDLQEIDSYATKLGIEMVGCIQALGHLEPTLRWSAYYNLRDTDSVILTSEEKSYELIRKMLEFWASAFKSRRIHLGMDETHDLGRGRFMDMNGYKRGYDIFNDHLKRVYGFCESLNLEPMIWSDMYFRMGSKSGDYYDKDLKIPPDVKNDIPQNVTLTYWDYYHDNEEFYREWINRHRKDLGFEPAMASGLWSWRLFWHNYKKTVKTAVPCIDACVKEGVKDFFFTVWADDGAFYNLESVLAGACSMAEKVYSKTLEMNEDNAEKLFNAVCKSDYAAHKRMAEMTLMTEEDSDLGDLDGVAVLWDDPILQIYRKEYMGRKPGWTGNVIKHFRKIAKSIAETVQKDEECFGYGGILLDVLVAKLELMEKLDFAYQEKNIEKLKNVAKLVPLINSNIDKLIESFRTYHYARYNPQGFEILQIRLSGQKERFKEIERRIMDLISGKTDRIPELHERASYGYINTQYNRLATASYFV